MDRRPFLLVNRDPNDQRRIIRRDVNDIPFNEQEADRERNLLRERANEASARIRAVEEEILRLQDQQNRLASLRATLLRQADEIMILRPDEEAFEDNFEQRVDERLDIQEREHYIEEEEIGDEEVGEEEEENPQETVNNVEALIANLLTLVENRRGAEQNVEAREFLGRFSGYIRSNLFNPSIEEAQKAIEFIAGDDEYDIFKFFAVIYRGYIPNPAEERFAFNRTWDSWRENFMRNIRDSFPRFAQDFENSSRRRGHDILLYRLNAQQVSYAIQRVIFTVRQSYVDDERGDAFVIAASAMFNETHMRGEYGHPRLVFEEAEVEFLWEMLINTLRLMRALFANQITLPDVLLNQRLYRDDVVNGTTIRLLQSYPFLLTKTHYYGYVNGGYELMMEDTKNKVNYLISNARVEDVSIKVRIKEVFTPEGRVENEDPSTLERWRVLTLDPLSFNNSHLFREHDEFNGEVARINLSIFASASIDELKEWFLNEIARQLKLLAQHYNDYELLDDGETVNMEFILIDYIQIIGIEAQNPVIPNRGPTLKTAFCKSASSGMVRKTAFFSECTSMGICIFEALWTWKKLDKIRMKSIDEESGLSYWKREEREKIMLRDFDKAPIEVKLMSLHGNINDMKSMFGGEIPIIVWEEDQHPDIITLLEFSEACLIIIDSHVFCADPTKVIRQLDKREKKKEVKELKWEDTGKFTLRPKYTKKEMKSFRKNKEQQPDQIQSQVVAEDDSVEDYYLDIETSINKETGKFTPYLICLVGVHEENSWWGDSCVEGFLEWLTEKVDPRKGVEVSHNHKSDKVNIWTYNGMKFDLVFLVRHFINMPEFALQGSIASIKGLSIGNVVFRDLLKICPFGSLAKQSDFWNTTLKKGSVNHDDITDEKIAYMERNPNDPYVQSLKAEIIEYCLLDCKVLQQCVEKYKAWVIENLEIDPYVISTAGLALRYWSTHHNPSKIPFSKNIRRSKLPKGLPKEVYPVVKESYKGGIVMVVKKIKEESKHLTGRDINSSYPFIMKNQRIPFKCTGIIRYECPKNMVILNPKTLNECFLYQVCGLTWKKGMRIPTIPKRIPEGLNHTTKHSPVDYIWGVELKYAMETGWIESGLITSEYTFASDFLFKSYVEELYDKRRAVCKRNGDTIGDKFYKLLLNSLYGKFGQKLYKKKVVCNDRKLAYYSDVISGVPEEVCDGVWLVELDDDGYEDQIGSCIHIASFITASARTNLMRAVGRVSKNFTEDNIYYMDTDCIITDGDFPEDLTDEYELGKWALEKNNITEYYAPAKKMYYLEYEGQKVKKSKGITSHLMNKEDYIELIEKGVVKGKIGGDKWIRSKLGFVSKHMNIKDLKVNDVRFYYENGLKSMPKFE